VWLPWGAMSRVSLSWFRWVTDVVDAVTRAIRGGTHRARRSDGDVALGNDQVVFARKVAGAKWTAEGRFTGQIVPADTVTADLRTKGNSLSFWKVSATGDGWKEAALAFVRACSPNSLRSSEPCSSTVRLMS
jgi:hypothetical protein